MEGKLVLMRVFEKRSARGNTDFVGRLAGARLLMFRDDRAEGSDPVWQIFLEEAAPTNRATAESAEPRQRPLRTEKHVASVPNGRHPVDDDLNLNDALPDHPMVGQDERGRRHQWRPI